MFYQLFLVFIFTTIIVVVPRSGWAHQKPCEKAFLTFPAKDFTVNTSNLEKQREFERLLGAHGKIEFSNLDLPEIDADPLTVAVHKASQFNAEVPTIVEDTALFVEGEDVGVNIRWLMDSLQDMTGRGAVWTVHLAYRKGHQVFAFKAEVHGHIVARRGAGFGFDNVFLPIGASKTLSEDKPDCYNARALAVEKLLHQRDVIVADAIDHWSGPWQ